MAKGKAKISNMLLAVQLTPDSEPLEVQTIQADYVAFDVTRYRQKWPSFEDAPFLWSTFLAFHGARRLGFLPAGQTWEQFSESVYQVSADQDAVEVDPTQPAAE